MDTLARTQKLEALGFERPKAEGLVQMVKQSIDEEVAKKTDLVELRADLKSDISEVRLEVGQVKSELKQDIADVRLEVGHVKSELKLDIAKIHVEIGAMKGEIGEMKGEFKTLHAKIDSLGTDLIKKLGGLIIVLWGLGLDWGKGYDLIAKLIDKI